MALDQQSQRAEDGRGPDADKTDGQSDRWARAKAVFLEAVEYPASERSAFVERATSADAELRREVESLLASEAAAGSFCETPAADVLGGLTRRNQAPSLAVGTRLGAYEITGFIAAGGMGAVYRARHTLLRREVAIKTVGPGFTDDAAKRRLIREARHASSLTHPNICAIYDVGEAGDLPFIVMEYIDGASLGDIIRAVVPPIAQALEYGAQIAGALEHAHRHGIVHRDLKSSNVVITGTGKAIVLDFGLARRVSPRGSPHQGDSTATNRDAFAGTLSHMAPELLRGEPADVRSDVWALGVLLYQLVSGELPFSRGTPFETSSAILTDPPRALSTRIPLAVRLIIERCLIKDPHARYQTPREVGAALDAVRRQRAWPVVGRLLVSTRRRTLYMTGIAIALALALVPAAATLRSTLAPQRLTTIALLPLASASPDGSASYYAEGVTDALIEQLGMASNVRVLSRVSAAHAAGTARSTPDVGARLGADAIVHGTLRRSDNEIALTLRLVRVSDGRLLWSDSLARSPKEILALEADLVRALAGAVQASMRPGASERLSTVRAVTPEAYEAYLKGRYEWNHRTPQSLLRAIEDFNRAISLDATYAPAHAGLADCYNQLGTVLVGTGSPTKYRPLAEAEAIKALQIDDASAEAHAALGYVRHYQLRWVEAEEEFRKALGLNPSFSLAHIWYANMLMSRARATEAIEHVNAARLLDPFSLVVNTNVGWVLDEAGRHDEAIDVLTRTLALDSTYVQARSRLVDALIGAGRLAEARAEAIRLLTLSDSSPKALATVALIDVQRGQPDSARAILNQLLFESRKRYVTPVSLAYVQAALGDSDDAMQSMDRAFAEGSNAIAYLDVAREFDPLRHDPRFQALRARAGLK